jgi:hypothetical protein
MPSRLHSLLQRHFLPPRAEEGGTAPASRPCCYYDLLDVEVWCTLLNELGDGLLDRHDGSALHMISKVNGSANALVGIILPLSCKRVNLRDQQFFFCILVTEAPIPN